MESLKLHELHEEVQEYFRKNNLSIIFAEARQVDELYPQGKYQYAVYMVGKDHKNDRSSNHYLARLPELICSYDEKVLFLDGPKGDGEIISLSLQYHGTVDKNGHTEVWENVGKIPLRVVQSKHQVHTKTKAELKDYIDLEENLIIVEVYPDGKIVNPKGHLHALFNVYKDQPIFLRETRVSELEETYEARELNNTRVCDFSRESVVGIFPEAMQKRMKAEKADFVVLNEGSFDIRFSVLPTP